MTWNPDRYLENLYNKNNPKYAFCAKNTDEWRIWRRSFKKALMKDLNCSTRKKFDMVSSIIEHTDFDGFTRQRVVYVTDEYLEMPSYILKPKTKHKKYPVIIACHGHGYGSREIIGLNADGSENTQDPGYQKNFALELVKRGFLVIVPEILGFGDRRLEEDKNKPLVESSCHRISTYLLAMGKTMAGARVQDIIRTVDYLYTREDVDTRRIGCMGISGGGLVCTFSTALDERIKVAVVSGYANTFKDSILAMYHCIDNFIPGLLKHGEMPDILGLIAPRPLLMESGMKDNIFPVEAAKLAFTKVKEIYELVGAGDKVDIDIFEGVHEISGRKAYSWFEKWIGDKR